MEYKKTKEKHRWVTERNILNNPMKNKESIEKRLITLRHRYPDLGIFRRGKKRYDQTIMIKCACGCGIERSRYDKKGRERRYIWGHGSRNRIVGIETRKKQSIIRKRLYHEGKVQSPSLNPIIAKKISLSLKGKKVSEITRKKLSETNKRIGKKPPLTPKGKKNKYKGKSFEEIYGKERAESIKKKISLSSFGRKISDEVIKRLSQFNKGRKHSEEWRKKIGIANTGKKRNIQARENISFGKLNYLKNNPAEIERLRNMAKENIIPIKDTKIEVKIQNFLKQLGYEFFTHQYIKEIEHRYRCDILIPTMNLVIECDGDYWHHYPIGNDIDHIRTKELLEKGFKVLRLWEFEIKQMDINKFKEIIKNVSQ